MALLLELAATRRLIRGVASGPRPDREMRGSQKQGMPLTLTMISPVVLSCR